MPTDLQEIAIALHSVANAIREAAPKPGPHVVGGPVPHPDERPESAIVNEEIRSLQAAVGDLKNRVRDLEMGCEAEAAPPAQEEAAPNLLKVPCGMCTHEVKMLRAEVGKKDRELAELRAALKAEQAAHAETQTAATRVREDAFGDALKAVTCVACHEAIDRRRGGGPSKWVSLTTYNTDLSEAKTERDNALAALTEARATARREALEEVLNTARASFVAIPDRPIAADAARQTNEIWYDAIGQALAPAPCHGCDTARARGIGPPDGSLAHTCTATTPEEAPHA